MRAQDKLINQNWFQTKITGLVGLNTIKKIKIRKELNYGPPNYP